MIQLRSSIKSRASVEACEAGVTRWMKLSSSWSEGCRSHHRPRATTTVRTVADASGAASGSILNDLATRLATDKTSVICTMLHTATVSHVGGLLPGHVVVVRGCPSAALASWDLPMGRVTTAQRLSSASTKRQSAPVHLTLTPSPYVRPVEGEEAA